MILLLTLLFSFFDSAAASPKVRPGTYSLFTESFYTAGFELRAGGAAVIFPPFDSEKNKAPPKGKSISGTWKETKEGLELTYKQQHASFRREKPCPELPPGPCYRFQAAKSNPNSPLKSDYPYVNWDENSFEAKGN